VRIRGSVRYARLVTSLRPMPLLRAAGPFDHCYWPWELKHDGFRALAHVEGQRCTLVSRRRHVYKQFPMLLDEIAHSVRCISCVLDGEIVCLASDGRSVFNRLLFRRDWPHLIAFDVLPIDGEDLRDRPIVERERRLRPSCRASIPGSSITIRWSAAARSCLRRCARMTLQGWWRSGNTAGIPATA
jgi:ATP-dependent DNA ligase